VFSFYFVHGGGSQGVQHAVAGSGADDEVIGKRGYLFDVEQDDVFAFFIFECVDDVAREI
jgi:hypothetical protein